MAQPLFPLEHTLTPRDAGALLRGLAELAEALPAAHLLVTVDIHLTPAPASPSAKPRRSSTAHQ